MLKLCEDYALKHNIILMYLTVNFLTFLTNAASVPNNFMLKCRAGMSRGLESGSEEGERPPPPI